MAEFEFCKSKRKYLEGKTVFISGASRGIGRAIAIRCAMDGANVAIVAKTATPHPKLPGTIFTVAKTVESVGGKALPLLCDIRDDDQINKAIQKTVETFGGIDILVNNASAISLTPTLQTDMKKYDLMHQINVRGTFAVSKAALPHLLKSSNPHILTMSPPLDFKGPWFAPHTAYSMSKYGMSMCVYGLSAEFEGKGIAVNALWPKTVIATSALKAFAGDQLSNLESQSRKADIIADAAYSIFCQPSERFSGQFCIDEVVLREQGVRDFGSYSVLENNLSLAKDLFVDDQKEYKLLAMSSVLLPKKQRSKL